MPSPPFPRDVQDELDAVSLTLDGLQRTRYLATATLCCVVYDYFLTLDEEIKFFWTGRWTLSRVLFFINRYFPVCVLISTLVRFMVDMSAHECTLLIHVGFSMSLAGVSVVQAIIVLRICYVYSRNLIARAFVVGTFIACAASTFVLLGVLWHDLEAVPITVPGLKVIGCTAPPSKAVWKLFVPNIILHTVLYLATTIPALRMRSLGRTSMVMDRLVMDGGIFYFVVFVVGMFSALGALSGTPLVTIPAINSNILLGVSSVAVSRLMLSIRSLAASLSLHPDWLLNNTELSRVNWKHGPHNGELIVEVDTFEELEMDEMHSESSTSNRAQSSSVHVSRVGVPNHPVYPGTRDYKSPPREKRKKPVLI